MRITNIIDRSLGKSFPKSCHCARYQAQISNDSPGRRVPDRLKRRDEENQEDQVLQVCGTEKDFAENAN